MSRPETLAANPGFPWLWLDRPSEVEAFLRARNWLESGERLLGCEKAGEGNMNLVLRLRTSERTLILKQSRPWVEKYPHIAAPGDRLRYELRFYEHAQRYPLLTARMPALVAADLDASALLLEDLPDAQDMTGLYAGETIESGEIGALAEFLAELHAIPLENSADFANRAMRALNHEHIFRLPWDAKNGLELERFEPGLTHHARRLQTDSKLRVLAEETGDRYLRDGARLAHGDYFPGSWLRTSRGLAIIDPEFCFAGDAEFDLGVALAHFALACQSGSAMKEFLSLYQNRRGTNAVDCGWIARYAGCEVVRRLIGVAQLPICPSTCLRGELLKRARQALLNEALEPLCEDG